MMMEAINWYFESVSAFWVSLAGGGLFKLILLWFFISWMCGRRGRWHCHSYRCHCRCQHCGCRCGHCPCGAGEAGDDKDEVVD